MSNKDLILKNPVYKWEWDFFERKQNKFSCDEDTSLKPSVLFLLAGSAEETLSYHVKYRFSSENKFGLFHNVKE